MKALVIVVIIALIAVGGFFLFDYSINRSNESAVIITVKNTSNSGNNSIDAQTKVFVLTGDHLKFRMDGVTNPDIKVKEGDKVRIEFTSTEGFHDWVVDEFNAATSKVGEGSPTFVEFTADKKGTFEYYCSVGSHRAQGMKGNLIVE